MKRITSLLITIFVLISAATTFAADRIVFWYPGEAGSTSEAQPVLDLFLDYIDTKVDPITLEGRYFNTVQDGLGYIQRMSPVVGIVSFPAWAQHKGELAKASVWMATLPLPGGKTTQQYALVTKGKTLPTGAPILSSEPLSNIFVRTHLFPKIAADAKIEQTPQMIFLLKKIADGSKTAAAILTPAEAATLARISADWAKSLTVIEQSKPVPSPRVILFQPTWKGAESLKAALLSAGSDPLAVDILTELRLKGFTTP